MSPRGGKREGAGKPALYGKPMKRKEVMLPDEAIAFFVLLGEGNFSAGVQKAWRSLTPLALDGGDSAAFQALSTPEVLSTLQGESTPAHRK